MQEYEDLRRLVRFEPLARPVQCHGLYSNFSASWSSTVGLLAREIDMLRPREAILEIDMGPNDFRQDGLPRADRRARTPGVVLTLIKIKHGHDLRYEVGTYHDWKDNVRAIALSLEALRKVDRYGVTKRGEQYAGWKQLMAPDAPDVEKGRRLIEQYGSAKLALKATHPDTSGYESYEDFRAVEAARG